MKLCKKITGGIAKAAEVVCMVMIALLVVVIVTELLRRNFLNQSYRGTIEVCGIAFLWMAFIGLIPLYHNSGLMLGVVMVVAFVAQYPYVSTRTYSTFSIPVPYTIQYIPMALAGAYMALKSVEQMVEEILRTCRPGTRLCIAANLTCEDAYVHTQTVKEWQGHVPDLSKRPCIFLLYK